MKAFRRILAIASAAVLVTIAGPAWAAGPYTITAGAQTSGTVAYTGSTTGAGPQVRFNTPYLELGCDSGTAAGTFNLGSNSTGENIGSIDAGTFTECVGPFGLPLTFTQIGTWTVDATAAPSGGVTPVTIENVSVHVEATGDPETWAHDITGSMDGTLDKSTQVLTITTPTAGAALFTTNVVGTFGLVEEGGPATLEMSYELANPAGPIAITSP